MKQLIMKNLLFIACLLFAFSLQGQTPQLTASDLLGCWIDSKEESTTTLSFYRPCDENSNSFDKFRFSFQLKENGQCNYLSIVARSSNKMANGTWTYDAEKATLHIYNADGRQVTQFTLQEYASDLIKFIKEG